jgi:hypothetical protein
LKSKEPWTFWDWVWILGDTFARPFEALAQIVRDTTRQRDPTTPEVYAATSHLIEKLKPKKLTQLDYLHPDNFAGGLCGALRERRPGVSESLLAHIYNAAHDLISEEKFLHVPAPPLSPDLIEQAKYRDELRLIQQKHTDFVQTEDAFNDALLTSLFALLNALPKLATTETRYEVEFSDLIEKPGPLIMEMLYPFYDPNVTRRNLYQGLRDQVDENVRKQKDVLPSDATGTTTELANKYLYRTPLRDLFSGTVPFEIPDSVLPEHRLVVAGTGTGKTQLIQADAYHYLQREERPGIVIIDSQGQMLPKLERLDLWRDDLIIIDPEDPEAPALNMFALPERIRGYDRNTREAIESDTIKLFGFIFSALSQELTGRQETAFGFTVRLMLSMPGATVRTLRELLEETPKTFDSSKFAAHIEGLDEDTKSFFKNQFFSQNYVITKQGIVQRLYGMLRIPAFNRMFGSSENRLDLFKELNEGKTILVNTSKRLLGSDASSIFGRYMIALAIGAAFQRIAVKGDHRLALLYIDEAKEYFSDLTLDELLTQVRKYNMGALIAFQNIDQLPSNLRPVVLANTSTKLVAGITHHDARVLAPDMRQSPDWLLSMKKGEESSEFACYVRNHTQQAVKLTIPFGVVEKAPQMTDEVHKALREANRRRLAARDDTPVESTVPEEAPLSSPKLEGEDPTKPAREW